MPDENVENSTTNQKIKSFFKKIPGTVWKWFKENWLVVLIIVAVSMVAFRGCNQEGAYQNLFDQYGESIQDYQRQLKDLRALQQEEQEEQDRRLQAFLEEINRIETEYKLEIQRIDEQQQTTQDEIVRDAQRDPGTLTARLTETFGIPTE